jgi:transposase
VRDWLPEGHLAWFVLDAVAGMDLGEFYGAYRADGVGRRAYARRCCRTVAVWLCAGVRSARKLERACVEDVAFKMIAMMETPDHATIARFVARHEAGLAELFGQVLRLCEEAGLVRPGVVAIDGTRMAGNASGESTRGFEEIAREILAEAKATDEAEDALYGEARGDELPEQLRTREGRAEFFRQARERRAAENPEDRQPDRVRTGRGPASVHTRARTRQAAELLRAASSAARGSIRSSSLIACQRVERRWADLRTRPASSNSRKTLSTCSRFAFARSARTEHSLAPSLPVGRHLHAESSGLAAGSMRDACLAGGRLVGCSPKAPG